MLNRYYEQELNHLRTLAGEFSRRNPALAPLLGSATAVDSDVERLLEGVAFLTGLVRQRLDDDFPEFTQGMAQLLFPHFLQPLPCMTVLQFSPRSQDGDSIHVPAGTSYASLPVDDAPTVFRSVFPVTIEPLTLESAMWTEQSPGVRATLELRFRFLNTTAEQWHASRLRFFLGGSFSEASRLYRLLRQSLESVEISSPGGPATQLPSSAIQASGFSPSMPLLPWPVGAHPAWRILQEYFALPEKLLFLDLEHLDAWRHREGQEMHIRFRLRGCPDWIPHVDDDSFIMNATPAVNLYEVDGHPIHVNHRQAEHRIQTASQYRRHTRIFSVARVTARDENGTDIEMRPFSAFALGQPTYQARIRPSPLESGGYDHYLSIPYTQGAPQRDYALSLRLLCTDGERPNDLRLGDICAPTDNSPPMVSCANIMSVTPHRNPFIQGDLLWRVLSHQKSNHVTLIDRDHLQSLLLLYLPQRDGNRDGAALRQIESIESVRATAHRRMVRGAPVEGSRILIDCRGDHFASPGSLYLFGCMLDEFFSGCAAMNTFTELLLKDTNSGDIQAWPAKTGQQLLL